MLDLILLLANIHLSPKQFGFLAGKSCSDAVSLLTEFLYKSLNDKKFVVALFVDLKKAYDTVNHDILLKKLELFGIRGIPLKWFCSYLENRLHRVKIGECFSAYTHTMVGVPQGSVLGSILFLIYMNDLPAICNKLFSVLYADDTCFSLADSNYNNLISNFNEEMIKFRAWLSFNRLSLNLTKTVALNFSKRRPSFTENYPICINNETVSFCDETRYLGDLLDAKLNFRHHVNYVAEKISKNIGIMFRLSKNVPRSVLNILYHSLIYPYLIYCNIIWAGTCDSFTNKILVLQKRVIRLIAGAEFLAHCDPLFLSLGILKIKDLYTFFCCMHVFKNRDKYSIIGGNTRFSSNLEVPYHRLELTNRSVWYNPPKFFNSLPSNVRDTASMKNFKIRVKEILLSLYSNSL